MRQANSILIVDDDPLWRDLLFGMLHIHCESVQKADDTECLAEVARRRYDLVTLDITMPHSSGKELFEAIEMMNLGCHYVVVTHLDSNDQRVKYFRHRGIPVILKEKLLENRGILAAQISDLRFFEPKELKALVVDDDHKNQKTYSSCLAELGICDVHFADGVTDAKRLLAKHSFDIFLIDLLFRDKHGELHPGGREVLACLGEHPVERRSLVVLTTSYPEAASELKGVSDHVVDARFETSGGVDELRKLLESAVSRWRVLDA